MSILEELKKETEERVKAAVLKIEEQKKSRDRVAAGGYVFSKIKAELADFIRSEFGIADLEDRFEPEPPPPHVAADLAFSSFGLAGLLKENPERSAEKIAAAISGANLRWTEKAETSGPYVNLFLRRAAVYGEILKSAHSLGPRYGETDEFAGKVAYMDFSHPNIAKPIGIGNTRSTILGEAVARIYEAAGCSVVRDNFMGDWGAQFGKLIYAYRAWGSDGELKQNPLSVLKKWYVEFHKKEESEPELSEKASELSSRLEKGDGELLDIWKRFRDLSIEGFEKTYKRLGIKFDTYLSESFFADSANAAIDECLAGKICRVDGETGAVVVDAFPDLPSFILRKGDGSTLYMARDLAAMKFRAETFHPDAMLFVVGGEQSLNFRQLFALCGAMGYGKNIALKHVGFGLVLYGGKKMATRRGTAVELEDILDQAAAKAKEIMRKKNPSLLPEELDNISEEIGTGAVIYSSLRQSREKNVEFDLERMLDFEGGSAAYLQYAYVRIRSILKQSGEAPEAESFRFENPVEFALALKLMFFPEVALAAAKNDSPHLVAVYLEELARQFNSFYGAVSVIGTEDDNLRRSRLGLVASAAAVIKKGLTILNIRVPEKM